jgi:hypothetical protein
MKQTIKVSRSGFPGVGNFSWMNYFVEVLSLKYDVIITSENPNIVFYSNLHYNHDEYDYYTKQKIKGLHEYGDNVKKVFISGEANPGYHGRLSNNHYCLGYEHINHENYLRFPTYVLDAFVLHNEGGLFDSPFGWLTSKRDVDSIMEKKKHFCSVVQSSVNNDRGLLYDEIIKKHHIKSSGPWRGTVGADESLNYHKYHTYSNPDYMGKIDGLVYRDKVKFFGDSYFNIAFQYTNTIDLTQEKIIHAYAGDSIPVFYGNSNILKEGFNPNAIVNGHDFESFVDVANFMDEVYNDKNKLKEMYSEPFFVNNELPVYFNEEYLLSFFEKMIND